MKPLITLLTLGLLGPVCAGPLHAATITYKLTGSVQITNVAGPDTLNLNGASFDLTAVLTDFTPTFVTDPNIQARADYKGDGTLTIDSLAPVVNRIDFIFID